MMPSKSAMNSAWRWPERRHWKTESCQPLAETFHNAEHASPSFGVGDVVCDKVKVLFAQGGSTRCEVWILGQLTEQVSAERSGLHLEQASVAQLVAKVRMSYLLAESRPWLSTTAAQGVPNLNPRPTQLP
jgi:hypothetical protein